MLIKATAEDIRKYGEFAYQLALDPAKSCYPTYSDGIKTKADFYTAAERALAEETSELLLYVMDGNVEGWISYYWIPEDKYLQLMGCNLQCGTEQALTELLDMLGLRFAGYTVYFGCPGENREAIHFLQAHGFRCVEQGWNHSFFFGGDKPVNCGQNVERISRENFDKFRAVYHADPETYWNCERILERLEDWVIYVYHDGGTPAAGVFLTGDNGYYEIYGVEFADGKTREDVLRELLAASLNACKGMGAKYMTYLCGEGEKQVLAGLGFQCVGQYLLYMKCLG